MRIEDKVKLINMIDELDTLQQGVRKDLERMDQIVRGVVEALPELEIRRDIRFFQDVRARIQDIRLARKIKSHIALMPDTGDETKNFSQKQAKAVTTRLSRAEKLLKSLGK